MNFSSATAAFAATSRSRAVSFSVHGSLTGSGVSKKPRMRFFIASTCAASGLR